MEAWNTLICCSPAGHSLIRQGNYILYFRKRMFGFSCCRCLKIVNIFFARCFVPSALVLVYRVRNSTLKWSSCISRSCILLSDLISEMIELLQHNLTQVDIKLGTCKDLQEAAEHLQSAAEKQVQSCQAQQDFLHKQQWVIFHILHASA